MQGKVQQEGWRNSMKAEQLQTLASEFTSKLPQIATLPAAAACSLPEQLDKLLSGVKIAAQTPSELCPSLQKLHTTADGMSQDVLRQRLNEAAAAADAELPAAGEYLQAVASVALGTSCRKQHAHVALVACTGLRLVLEFEKQ
jgi:hypothetical protein